MAVSTLSAGFEFFQQSSQAKATDKAIQENYRQQTEALQRQYDQTTKQATDEMSVRAREAMIENARIRAVNGESGLAGASNDRIENESKFNLGTDIASIESNRQNSLRQLYEEGKSLQAGTQSQINQPSRRPSLIGTGLQIAGTAVNTTGKYQAAKNKQLPAAVTG